MNTQLQKLEGENEEQFIWRLGQLYDAGLAERSWAELADIINHTFRPEGVEYTESTYRKQYQSAKKFFEAGVFNDLDENEYLDDLAAKRRELEKERVKLRTEKIEYNRWLREEARDEMILECVSDAIAKLEPVQIPTKIETVQSEKGFVLAFGDEHYGAEFEIKGLHGEIINAYSPEIFERRMWQLFNRVVDIICKEEITDLHIFSMGDFADGCLRVSQLMKLRYGVVDGTLKYAEFISQWLYELSRYVHIHYQMTDGNHTELRMLGQPKGTFTEDNMGKVVASFIKLRLQGNPNFEFIENPSGYIFTQIAGYNFLGIHGEEKDLKRSIKDFSKIYSTPIDYLITGHVHHGSLEDVGINSAVITIPSLMGTDPYALKLKYLSNPGASLIVMDSERGKECEYSIALN